MINIIPAPKKVVEKGETINIGQLSRGDISFCTAGGVGDVFEEAVNLFKKEICEKMALSEIGEGNYKITLKVDNKSDKLLGEESYYIDASENECVICGFDDAGAYYGIVTLLKLIKKQGNNFYIPAVQISDYPTFKTRGHFAESRCGSEFIDLEEWKKIIDYIAGNKCNTLVISLHGCWTRQWDLRITEHLHIPIKKYPELKTPRHVKYYSPTEDKWIYKKDVLPTMVEDDFFGEVIAYGKRKNVEVLPLFNSYGHNTMIPRIFPEMSAKDKDGNDTGFSICTECDSTYEIMFNIYDEIIERYLKPNGITSFSIGMDEVMPLISIDENDFEKELSPFCECEKCKKYSHGELVMRFIVKAVKHLKKMGMKNVYIYHDVLFRNGLDEEKLKSTLIEEDIMDVTVIDWWSYSWEMGKQFGGRANEISTAFRSVMKPWTGYYHWDVIEDTFINIYDMANLTVEKGFDGMISYDGFEYCFDKNISYVAEAVWNGKECIKPEDFNERYALSRFNKNTNDAVEAMRELTSLTERTTPEGMNNVYFGKFLYYTYTYVRMNKDKGYRTPFPEQAYKYYYENPASVKAFLSEKMEKAKRVLALLENDKSPISEIHKTTALMYFVPANEIVVISDLVEKFNDGKITGEEMIKGLDKLIFERHHLMRMVEKTRIPGNNVYLLRSLSVSMQYIADIKCFVENAEKEGKKVKIDLTDLKNIKSEMSEFLR